MGENIHIDKSTQETIPDTKDRLKHALIASFLGFLLTQIIGFWMFPGPGIFGLYMFSSVHSSVGFVGNIANICILAFLGICFVLGWFNGKYFIHRLKGYIEWWKFW